MNIAAGNVLSEKLQNEIIASNPDVIVILEWNGNNIDLEKFNSAGYRTILDHPRKLVHGLCVLSKHDGHSSVIESPVETPCAIPLGQFRFRWKENTISLFAVHAPPPVSACKGTTGAYVKAVAGWVNDGRLKKDMSPGKKDDLVIMAGDFNSIATGEAMSELRANGLEDAYSEYNMTVQTWKPYGGFPFIVKIDYILFANQFKSISTSRFSIENSDHLGLITDLVMDGH